MPLTIPPELKKITPYVRRAEELDKDKANAESRLVAYYSRQYAVLIGIDLPTSAAGKTCLGDLLGALEEEKEAMNSFTRDEAKFLCRKFADKIFDKADLEDRTGDATKATAKTFYAAASFLEVLNQFYKGSEEDPEELEEIKKRAKYGKWKATEILKAIKEGRKPTPGGYGEDEPVEDDKETEKVVEADLSPENEQNTEEIEADPSSNIVETESNNDQPPESSTSTQKEEAEIFENNSGESEEEVQPEEESNEEDLPPPPTYDFDPKPVPPAALVPPVAPKPPITITRPTPIPPPTTTPSAMLVPPPSVPKIAIKKKSKLSKADFADATELTRFAMAALEDKNSELAAQRLEQAQKILGQLK